MNVFNIRRAFRDKKEKKWDKLYWCIDLHDVVIEGKYNKFNEGAAIFPHAKDFFRWACNREDIILILWTSSHADAIEEITSRLFDDGIMFDYVNSNPEVESNSLCEFDKKFYFNILLDDKAGFEGATDWKLVIDELKAIGEWNL
jgi:hypothetical protein